jgi:hypothetical protein
MSAMTNFRAEDMPGANKEVAKNAPKKAPAPKKEIKVEKPVIEEVVVEDIIDEEETLESE